MTDIFRPAPTSGVGVPVEVKLDSHFVTVSLGGTNTHQIDGQILDAAGDPAPGTALTLSAAADASGGATVYTGTITGGGTNAFAGRDVVVAGFTTVADNGTFTCTASSATTLTLDNSHGVSETHAGTATLEGKNKPMYTSRDAGIATVSSAGLITGAAIGHTLIWVEYPAFDNGHGTITNVGNAENGRYWERIVKRVWVTVTS